MKYILMTIALVSVLFINSCSDDSNAPNDTNMSMVGSLSSSTLTTSNKQMDIPLQNNLDEIKVLSVRILISNIKIHDNAYFTWKAGQAVYTANTDIAEIKFAEMEIPNGTFNKIKYEFHRFSASEAPNYADDDLLKDFATSERYTVIIEGETVSAGIATPFTYKSDVVANLNFDFEPPVTVEDNSHIVVDFEFQTENVFIDKGELLDPNDQKNRPHIDNGIKAAIKANKK